MTTLKLRKLLTTLAGAACLIASLCAQGIGALAAQGRDPAYVGTWAKTTAACKAAADTANAPFVFKAMRFDQFETHCEFTEVGRSKLSAGIRFDAKIKMRCLVEGNPQPALMTATIRDNTLSYRWGTWRKSVPDATLVRCR